jgi:ATP-dependent Clp protease ATP-binding subunit ClpC
LAQARDLANPGVLRHHFRPEFLNRIDEFIVFHALNQQQIKDIVNLQLEQVRRLAEDKDIDIHLKFDSNLIG